jgi:hypothetical protein
MSATEVASAYMEQKHYEAADRARRYAYIARTIPGEGTVPKPPSARRKASSRGSDLHTGNAVLVHPTDRQVVAHSRKKNPFIK